MRFRALVWICGGNLPLVPGDSCHCLEIATSVANGEGPVKHYVGSFFRDYSHIRENRGGLDDWDVPLDAYVRALAFRIAGSGPDSPIDHRIVAAKACSFILNLLCLPALYVFARCRFDARVALGAMAALAVLPVHAIYAGFVLRESLVAFVSILAVWTLTEVFSASHGQKGVWVWGACRRAAGRAGCNVAHDRDCAARRLGHFRPGGPWTAAVRPASRLGSGSRCRVLALGLGHVDRE